ncbi:MAG: hypothetical protein ACYYK0_03640 [Candidatus Eutrophobiaceae bacterium]
MKVGAVRSRFPSFSAAGAGRHTIGCQEEEGEVHGSASADVMRGDYRGDVFHRRGR